MPEEIAKVGAWCAAQPYGYGVFVRAVFALLIGAGVRATELCVMLEKSYLGDRLRFIRKGNKECEIPLGIAETTAVEHWLAIRRDLGLRVPWLLVRVYKDERIERRVCMKRQGIDYICGEASAGAGVEPFSAHDCRRTFCTASFDRDVDLGRVQRWMNHEDPKTTVRYDRRGAEADAEARRRIEIWKPEWARGEDA